MPFHVRHAPGFLAATLLAAAGLLSGCGGTPPEEALRASVAGLEAAIESREPGAIADVLATDFAGPDGMDRAAARRLAQLVFLRNREVAVALGPLDIDLQGGGDVDADATHATVRFTAALTGGAGGWLPESGSVYRVETGWRRDGDAWEMTSARWERDL